MAGADFRDDQHRRLAERLLARMEERKRVDESGKVSFEGGLSFKDWEVFLGAMLRFGDQVPEAEVDRLTWRALVQRAPQGVLEAKTWLEEVRSQEREYLARKPTRYVLLSTLSLDFREALPAVQLPGARVTFPDDIPRAYEAGRRTVEEGAESSLVGDLPSGYRWVRAAVQARCDSEAADKALDAIDLLRGIWNLWLNRRIVSRPIYGGPRTSVNQIRVGPVHSVHLSGGRLEREAGWYDPNYRRPSPILSLGKNLPELLRFSRWARRRLGQSQYRGDLERWLRLYNRALDELDYSTAFLRLWQVLEAATALGTRPEYKVAARRAGFLFADTELHRLLLSRLKDVRNDIVHAGREPETMETYLFSLKLHVEELLLFHLRRSARFASPAEGAKLLELPPSREELLKNLRLVRTALKYRS